MKSPGSHVGLCFTCRHARQVRTPRSEFWLCERSFEEPAYERYPRLPVLRCNGFEPRAPKTPGAEPEPGAS